MHMADALLSPAVGGTMWAVTAGTIVYASARVRKTLDDRKIPLMGVMAAFVFAIQMVNVTIPGTGSSGHLLGGLLLSIILGPDAACLAIASVILVQGLFFADGGLLAMGCNIFNMGLIGCYLGYPIYKKLIGDKPTGGRLLLSCLVAAVVSLQAGALAVVLETTASGISELPFSTFLVMMLPIHLAIGIVEALITTGIVAFVWKARPEILDRAAGDQPLGPIPVKQVLVGLAAAAVVTAGVLSWFASSHPDGLEWSLAKVTGSEELAPPADPVHKSLAALQEKTSFLPDYDFKHSGEEEGGGEFGPVSIGTSVSGLLGGLFVLLVGLAAGFALKRRHTEA